MKIQPVAGYNYGQKKLNFKEGSKSAYENPIDRAKERSLAVLSSVGGSLAAGAAVGGLATCFINEGVKHRYGIAGAIGAAAAVITAALTLPAKLYDTKVKSFTREKEMEVFSRDREVKSNLLGEVDKEVKNEEIPLDQKINHYATMVMASNGSGMLIKGVNN